MNQHVARYLEANSDTSPLTLGELAHLLAQHLLANNTNQTLGLGFDEPHSWRGDYQFIAFEPAKNAKVKDMLADVEGSIGKTFMGYKGGDYTMDESNYGREYSSVSFLSQ